jgi:copper ion binding protein
MNSSLEEVIVAMHLSRIVYRRIILNFLWAFGFNATGIPIAAGVLVPFGILLPPWAAGLAMALSSVSVVASSLSLNWYKRPALTTRRGQSGRGLAQGDAVLKGLGLRAQPSAARDVRPDAHSARKRVEDSEVGLLDTPAPHDVVLEMSQLQPPVLHTQFDLSAAQQAQHFAMRAFFKSGVVGCSCGNKDCRCPPIRYVYSDETGGYAPLPHKCADYGCGDACTACDQIVEESSARRLSNVLAERAPSSSATRPVAAVLRLTGMSCGKCVHRVKNALEMLPGVTHVNVDLASAEAHVEGNGVDAQVLCSVVSDLGFGATLVPAPMSLDSPQAPHAHTPIELEVTGMSCNKCVKRVTAALGALVQVQLVDVSLESGKVVILPNASITAAELCAVISELGFSVSPKPDPSGAPAEWMRMVLVCKTDPHTCPRLAAALSGLKPPIHLDLSSSSACASQAAGAAVSSSAAAFLERLLASARGGGGREEMFVAGLSVGPERVGEVAAALEAQGLSVLPVCDGWAGIGSCFSDATSSLDSGKGCHNTGKASRTGRVASRIGPWA